MCPIRFYFTCRKYTFFKLINLFFSSQLPFQCIRMRVIMNFLITFFPATWLAFPFLCFFIVTFHHFQPINGYMQRKHCKFDTNSTENDCKCPHCIQFLSVTQFCDWYTTGMLQSCTFLTLSANSTITTRSGDLENILCSHHNLKTTHFGLSLF